MTEYIKRARSIAIFGFIVLIAALTACGESQPLTSDTPTQAPASPNQSQTTATPMPAPTDTPTPEHANIPTPEPADTQTPTPTNTPVPEPTNTPTPEPTNTPTPEPTSTPTPEPTSTPTPEPTPTNTPTPEPTSTPTPEPTPTSTPEPTAKLLAIYMVGSDLEDGGTDGPEHGLAGTKDFKELIEGYESLTDEHPVEVIVAFGGADKDGWRGMKFADMDQIIADGQDGAFGDETGRDAYLYQDDYANMDDAESLTLFLEYLRDAYPNPETRFLTFWDHGNTYKGFGGDTNFKKTDPYTVLSMDEITRSFQNSQPGVFDLIGFDACLMVSVEVAKVIEPFANYMIASEELEPGHGWLWSDVIRYYATQDSIVDAGKLMVDYYVQNVHGGLKQDGRTLSLLDLSRYDDLVAALDPVVASLAGYALSDDHHSMGLVSGVSKAGEFGEVKRHEIPPASVDLKHLAQSLSTAFSDSQISSSLDALIVEINRFVIHSKHDGSRPYSNGIAIALPRDMDPQFSAYKLNDTWREFESAYAALRSNDTAAPTIVEHI